MIQRSLVILKPETIKRGISGEIINRLERAGLKIVGMKMVHADKEFVKKHYLTTDDNLKAMGNKTLEDCELNNIDPVDSMGTGDPLEIGRQIWEFSVEYLSSGPVVAIVFEGPMAISNIRSLLGHTFPSKAAPGTIRRDFALDSGITANARKRSVYNLAHASGNEEEAENEIKLWFKEDELFKYRRTHEDLYAY